MVINFREVKAAVERLILARLDHRHLNDVLGELTTAENLVHWMARALLPELGPALIGLELWETRVAAATLEPEDVQAIRQTLPRLHTA